MDTHKLTRLEVIDSTGRAYVVYTKKGGIQLSFQDDDRTLKVFVDNEVPVDNVIKSLFGK